MVIGSEKSELNRMLGSTAHWTAAVRARESKRKDRLFNDPWAADLAGEEGRSWIKIRSEVSTIAMVLRTRFFDDFLRRIAVEEKMGQVVLMAAGLDTRAFRLSWPEHLKLFELDLAPVLEYKERILRKAGAKSSCARRVIFADLTAQWEDLLFQAGFDAKQPSGWLMEGLLFYLSPENLTHLLERTMNLVVSGSYLGFDIINHEMLTSEFTKDWVKMQADSGAPWLGTMDDPWTFMAAHGWESAIIPLGAPEANYNRWPYPPITQKIPGMPHLWFVTGEKK
jgi:methyltransferase (TIGR00027 family)